MRVRIIFVVILFFLYSSDVVCNAIQTQVVNEKNPSLERVSPKTPGPQCVEMTTA